MFALGHIKKKNPGNAVTRAEGTKSWTITMSCLPNASAAFKPDASSSSGTAFDGGWRRYWAIESARVGTDWPTLLARAAGILYAANVSGPSS